MNAPLILLPDHMRLKVAVDIINEDQLHSVSYSLLRAHET